MIRNLDPVLAEGPSHGEDLDKILRSKSVLCSSCVAGFVWECMERCLDLCTCLQIVVNVCLLDCEFL